MQKKKKEKWTKPKLIILTRGKDSGERVLSACKTGRPVLPSGPQNDVDFCTVGIDPTCLGCNAEATS